MTTAAPRDEAREHRRCRLYRDSVLVTGSHYSITTLLGAMLARSRSFHLLFEPANPTSRLGIRTVPSAWRYALYEGARYEQFRDELSQLIAGEGVAADAARRLGRSRSPLDLARVGRLVAGELARRLAPRPAVIKEPFLAFTARTMQRVDGLRVVIGVSHPARWVESIVRRDGGFDFAVLHAQPALLEALPDFADRIAHFASEPQPPLRQAVLAWQCIQTFHARYMLPDPRTLFVRQNELVARPREVSERLFAFAGVGVPPGMAGFLAAAFGARAVDGAGSGERYIARDAQGTLDKWRGRLAREEQALIRRETEALAAELGFGEEDWAGVP